MNIKNIIENIVLIVVMFIGLGVYTNMVLRPIVVESIRQENTKIENNIDSKISNKFKKIDELNARLDNSFPSDNTQSTSNISCEKDKVCIKIEHLTNRQKKRLGIK